MNRLPAVRLPSPLFLAVLAGMALACVPALATGQPAEGSFDRTLTVSGAVELDVTTGSGSIEVQAGPAGSVRVVGRIRVGDSWLGSGRGAEEKVRYLESHPPIEQAGNAIHIGHINDPEMSRNVSISYQITAPPQCRLRSRSGSGSQRIGDIAGPVDARTGSGGLRLGNIDGQVTASAGSGTIEVEKAGGGLSAKTGSGSVRVREVRGTADVSTGSGSVEVTQSAAGEVRVSASSGGVRLQGVQGPLHVTSSSGSVFVQGMPSGEWQVSSSSGSVTLAVPETAAFDLDAQTTSGSIDTRHPVTVAGTIGRHRIAGKVRGGGPSVRLRASSGSIRIE